ncbi:hypothetical protein [Litorimonas sp. WD9-15]
MFRAPQIQTIPNTNSTLAVAANPLTLQRRRRARRARKGVNAEAVRTAWF